MANCVQITLSGVSFHYPNLDQQIIQDLHLGLSSQHIGLVGQNGCGKSTLIKLLLGELTPTQGEINIQGKLAYVAQLNHFAEDANVANVLGVAEKLQALERIEQGSTNAVDFELLGEDWLIRDRIGEAFSAMDLNPLPLQQSVASLSGGEKTRLMLMQALLQEPNFLILDEPTNNLDADSRKAVYAFIDTWHKGLLVASHDRELLRHMDEIIELTPVGIFHYGGNYDFYVEEKYIHDEAKKHEAHARLQNVEKKHKTVQKRFETHERAFAKGDRARKAQIQKMGSYDKLGFKRMKGISERTLSRIKKQANRQTEVIEKQLQEAKAAIPVEEHLSFNLPKPDLARGKQVLNIQDLIFGYEHRLFDKFNLNITGPERIALCGANGSGKSTLIQLILGQLKPESGLISLGVEHIAYLDQFCSALSDDETILENFKRMNPDQNDTQCHQNLAHFKFRNKQALVKVSQLSGGERLRALLACVLMASTPPQLLILDEPTNHLDLQIIQYLEKVLKAYEGALIVVSHDADFLEGAGVSTQVNLSGQSH